MSAEPGAVPAATMSGALAGVRILDVSSLLAGPLCTMFLADFGAEVVKVERPGKGDEVRFWGNHKDGVGLYHKVVNRNKRVITLDLHTSFGTEVVKRLAADVDVVVENFRPGTMEKWGLGYDVLSALNPRLVMLRISGFGQSGPYSHRPGFGTLAEAYAGFAHINGTPDGPPLLPSFGLADASTGLMAAFLTLTAITEQRRSGRGQVVDLALYETLLTLIGPHVVDYDQLGLVQQRTGSRLSFVCPRNTYLTRDGHWVSIAGSAQSIFERICHALDVPGLVADPRFRDNRMRLKHATDLERLIAEAVARFDRQDLLRRFEEFQAAISTVNDVSQIVEDPHIAARENIVTVADPELGRLRMQNVVGRLSKTPGRVRSAGPPVGAHNREVLVDQLGYSPAQLEREGISLGEEA